MFNRLHDYWTQFRPNARLFLLATIISGVTLSGFQLFFNIYLKARGFDPQVMGLLNSLPSTAGLLASLPLGFFSDRIGRRTALLAGLGLSTLSSLALLEAPSLLLMAVASIFNGLAHALYNLTSAPFMMAESSPRERTTLFSLNFGLITLSGAAGNLVAGQLPAWFGGWLQVDAQSAAAYQAVLVTSVLCGGLALMPLWFIREVHWVNPRAAPRLSWRELLARLVRPAVLKLALPNLLIGGGAALLIPYLALYFSTIYQVPDATLGVMFSILSITTGMATVIGPRLTQRWGSKMHVVVYTQGAAIVCLALVGFAPFFWLAALAFLARGALMNMANPLYSAFAMEQTPENERGAVNAVLQISWQLGWAVGPFVSGLVQARYGFTPLFVATIIMYALANLLSWWFFVRPTMALKKN